MAVPASASLAARVAWLFAVAGQDVIDEETGEARCCRVSPDVVGAAIAVSLRHDTRRGIEAVAALQQGHRVSQREMMAFAAFFGVPARYLADDDPALVEAVENDLFDSALQGCGLRGYRVCRARVTHCDRRRARTGLLAFAQATDADTATLAPPVIRGCSENRTEPPVAHHDDQGSRMGPDRPMSAAELASLCDELVWQLDLRPPLDPHEMCRRLGQLRGRRITAVARDLGVEVSVGHLRAGPRSDRIGYDAGAPAPLAAHIIFHEIIHIVRGHLDGPGDRICGTRFGEEESDDSGLYTDWREWEAETAASCLSELARRRPHARTLARNARPADQAIAAAFGLRATH